jgi:hypothetical protein
MLGCVHRVGSPQALAKRGQGLGLLPTRQRHALAMLLHATFANADLTGK